MFKTIRILSQETRTPIDTDGDGIPDRFEVDTDGDGNIDRIEFDPDQDGNIDRIAHLDDDGRWVQVDRDLDDDGNIDRITHYAFDSGGTRRVTRREVDLDDDGTIDRSEAYIYEGGNRTRINFDLDNDGMIDRTARLNAEGHWERVELDVDDDGTIDRTVHRNTDGSGTINRIDFDDDADGTTDRSEFYTQNTDNDRTRVDFDDDADGMIDRITHYAFDEDGNRRVTRRDADLDDDGTIDRIAHLNAEGRWERVERDLDDDGTTDRIETYTYDENGNRTRAEFDDGADGMTDRAEDYRYNSIGRLTRTNFDDNNDGTTDRSEDYGYFNDRLTRIRFDDDEDNTFDRGETYTYDENGRLTQIEFDDDGDNNPDRRVAYTYDANGNRNRTEFDDDADGTIDRITHFAFDEDSTRSVTRRDADLDDDGNIDRTIHLNAEGRWERVEWDDDDDGTIDRTVHRNTDGSNTLNRTDFDGDGDGTTDRSEFYTQNSDGNRDRTNFDDDADGTIDRSETYSYDANDRVSQTNFDDDNDGTTDRNETYTYDANDRVSQTNFDDDNDGTTDRSESYTYDDDGRVSQTDFDDDNDGTTDRNESYTYDVNDRVSQTNFDDDNDGTTDRSESYTYDANDRVSQTNFDDDNDGTTDRSETYTYDDDGRVSQTNFDDDNDGTTDRSETYTYDTNGNLVRTDFDDDNDGRIDRTTETGPPPISRVPLSSLDGTNGFILNGIAAADQSGRSVSAGDVNGDGYDDLIISANNADPNGDNSGETYIVYGGASAPGTGGVLDLSRLALDGNGFTLAGIAAGDDSGVSASSAGDVNGDGYDDLIIGATGVGSVQGEYDMIPGPGEVYVVYGGATGADLVLDRSTLDGTRGFALTGIANGDMLGQSVSSAGDVNGDGYDDLIIGANGVGSSAGATYVVYGGASAPGTDGVLDLGALNGTNGFILNGIDAGDQSGQSVSSAGDVNGDGYDDLIIGSRFADPNGNSSGETYIVYGGASAPGTNGVLDLSDLDGTNGFTLIGSDRNDRVGQSVSSAGDVNGDGYDDLIIGADGANGPDGENLAGEIHVVYGGASAPGAGGLLDLGALNGTNGFTLTGIDAYDRSGFSVSSAGDINGDGYDDLIIGAANADPNGDSDAGETYIVYGGASAPGTDGVLDLSALDGSNGFILTGIDAYDNSGRSVSSAGDVNGDGYDDLIIGAYAADPDGDMNAGETYVVYGGATGTESLVPVTAQGIAAADNFTGNAGDDSFTAIATNDVVRGGAGDDTIRITALDFAAIDGGTGQDTLVLDGAGLALDLTGAGHASVDSVEVFDLSGTGANSLVLDALAVFDVTEEREGGAASLDVLGNADDRVELSGSNFVLTGTAAEDGVTYNIYRDGNAQLRVETGVQVVTVPVFTSPSAVSVAENQTAAYEAAATDDEGDALVYSLSGTDAALFTINANTGEVSFIAPPDFDMPGDDGGDNVYDIIVTASDGTNSRNHNVAITVTNDNDNIPVFTSPAAANAQENQTAAYMAAATDADGDTLVYSLSGTDADLFTIDANTGEVSFIEAPDFEAPGDDGGDNVYDIIVTASDGTNSTNHNVAITVTSDNDNIPVFTSPAAANAQENQTAAYMAAAADADGDTLVYSLSGTDAALFTIDAATGEVSFRAAPDFEAPGDDGGDNVYDIIVTAFRRHN